jgi:hypothetical protein
MLQKALNAKHTFQGAQCYDLYFRRFWPIFGGKNFAFFLKTNLMIIFSTLTAVIRVKKPIFSKNFGENIFNILPRLSDTIGS